MEYKDIIDCSILNRNNMLLLQLEEVASDFYFIHVLFLRLEMILMLWVLSRILPRRIIVIGTGDVICLVLGMIMAASVWSNGIWGSWFVVCALLPQGIFYLLGYRIWRKVGLGYEKMAYGGGYVRKERILTGGVIVAMVVIGCLCEAYLSPKILENVIKS